MKIVLGIGALVVAGLVGLTLWSAGDKTMELSPEDVTTEQVALDDTDPNERRVVADGTYVVDAGASSVNWAGKKPLIEGYINSGSIAVTDGTILVADQAATGEFTIDMDTLSVSNTPTKPGSETALEGHLKGERWFDVGTYPEASFRIIAVTPRADSTTTYQYDISGELTMKGVTAALNFPATIYADPAGELHAIANFEFDRTKWGITSGSGSLFDNLADNVIDDMVALSFNLVAEKQ